MDIKSRIITSVAVSTFLVFTVFIYAPSQLFLTNVKEFNVSYFELLGYLFIVALPIFLIIAIINSFFPKNLTNHKKIVALLLSISLLLWFQGNIMVWDYGLLTGGVLEFNVYFLIFNALIWFGVIILAYFKSSFFYQHARFVSTIFVVILISLSLFNYFQTDIPDSSRYTVDKTNEFTFSKENNVIILVLDMCQSDIIQQIIDENEEYKIVFDGFTYYRNTLAGFPTTYASIPNILTGQYYDNSIPFSDFLNNAFVSSSSIPNVLTDEDFEVDFFVYRAYPDVYHIYLDDRVMSNVTKRQGIEAATIVNIYDAALFRYAPDFLKRYIYSDGKWFLRNIIKSSETETRNPVNAPSVSFSEKSLTLDDVSFINDLLIYSNTIDSGYIFKIYGINGCHDPFLLNEELEYEDMEGSDAYERQAKASLKITNLFLEELKRLEIFDNSMIFIIADHGIRGDVQSSAHPLFLVKKYNNQGQMTVSDAPISLSDIPITIFSELSLEGDFIGESIFDLTESSSRERRFLFYNWNDNWSNDYLPTMKEFIISDFVWL
ncbi:MAG: hypothetical protein JSV74_03255, partial [Dehalococcoidia bacterium]